MSRLNELDFAPCAIERAEYAVNSVARVAKDMADAPLMETLHKKIAYRLGHRYLLTKASSRFTGLNPACAVRFLEWRFAVRPGISRGEMLGVRETGFALLTGISRFKYRPRHSISLDDERHFRRIVELFQIRFRFTRRRSLRKLCSRSRRYFLSAHDRLSGAAKQSSPSV
jgi:hypothetical protein